MNRLTALWRCLSAALIGLALTTPTLAGSGTIVVKDGSGASQTYDVITDGATHFVGMTGVCDGTAAAQCAAVKAASTAAVATDPALVVAISPNNTVAATQSGTWNITNISGTVSLPTGAATAANQTSQITQETATAIALGTTADAPCTLPATTTACSQIAVAKATANAANSPPPLGTSGGWTPKMLNALSTTVTAVKSSAAGQLGALQCGNTNASEGYVQVFDVATAGGVTLGTTTPKLSIPIAATSTGGLALSLVGFQFANGIQVAATTTATGSTALGTALDCNAGFN